MGVLGGIYRRLYFWLLGGCWLGCWKVCTHLQANFPQHTIPTFAGVHSSISDDISVQGEHIRVPRHGCGLACLRGWLVLADGGAVCDFYVPELTSLSTSYKTHRFSSEKSVFHQQFKKFE